MADRAALFTLLADDMVQAEPLTAAHRAALRAACAGDEDFWQLYPRSFGEGHFDDSFNAMIGDASRFPFALFAGGGLVGMSGYLNIDAASGALEIGGTYLTRTVRGTGLNGRFKRLLIGRAFACGFQRIAFCVDARNGRSLAAVEKLGAVREGVLRRNRRIWTGYVRDTVLFSILAEEWRGA
jgi:RimJ/RimL family protein N-acetyltransferase